jgi:ankyrin repeat protein
LTAAYYAVFNLREWQYETMWTNGYDCPSILQLLVAYGARLDYKDSNGQTLFQHSVQRLTECEFPVWTPKVVGGLKEVLLALVEHGEAVDSADWLGYTALHWAAG